MSKLSIASSGFHMRTCLVLAAGISLFSSFSVSAENCTAAPESGKYYSLINRGSGQALDIAGKSITKGAKVIQWPNNNGRNQHFLATSLGDGYWSLKAEHSGMALDVAKFSTDDGGKIVQYSYWGGKNQQWQLKKSSGGGFNIVSRLSGKSLTTDSDAKGAKVYQKTDAGSSFQRWYFNPVDGKCVTPTNIAPLATATTSYVSSWETLSAVNDNSEPANSNDKSSGAYGNWNNPNSTQWVEYEWSKNYSLSSTEVYWFDDNRGVLTPTTAVFKYWDGNSWIKAGNLPLKKDTFNSLSLGDIVTNRVKVSMLNSSQSTGILEWRVLGVENSTTPLPAPSQTDADPVAISGEAVTSLQAWLETARASRSDLEQEAFVKAALTKEDAQKVSSMLWKDLSEYLTIERKKEVDEKVITQTMDDGVFSLKYEKVYLGDEPQGGRSLFISMHGGGNTSAATNDSQWKNQIGLAKSYAPKDALWIAPRAPTNDWNMWFKDHIDPLFDRLITNMIVFEGVNPDKIYLTGYSAGGDAVYQLGPRMADRWAAAAMSAGQPNAASPLNLRNIGFAIHVGGDDTGYNRNLVAKEWGDRLDALQKDDPEGYDHQVEVHEGLSHWMKLADKTSIPYVQSFQRNLAPNRVVWNQVSPPQSRFYWLYIPPEEISKTQKTTAQITDQTVHLTTTDVSTLVVRLADTMVDMDAPISIVSGNTTLFKGVVPRTIFTMYKTLQERQDPAAVYLGEVEVKL